MDEQAERIRAMFKCFTSAEDVLKAERMTRQDLDKLCVKAFDMTLDEAAEAFAAQGRAELHAAQLAAAKDGNNSMLLLLGKTYLGQSEAMPTQEVERKATVLDAVRDRFAGAADRKSKSAH